MIWFVLGAAALLLSLLLGQRFVRADPKTLARNLARVFGVSLMLAAIVLAYTGRFGLASSAGIFGWMLFFSPRFAAFRRSAGRPSGGQASAIETAYLRMRLDHDTGALSGEVLKGRFSGRSLESLSVQELISLYDECSLQDPESAPLVETYLDRRRPDWRESWRGGQDEAASGKARGGGEGPMSREDAYRILGLEPGASEDEIKRAHRRLMKIVHPDQGGSNYLAAKINRAKDILVG